MVTWSEVEGEVSREKPEFNEAVELEVLGLEDDTPAAFTDLLEDSLVGDGLADHGSLVWKYLVR